MATALRPRRQDLDVGVGDVLDGAVVGEVDGLGDGAGEEGLGGGHHLDVAHASEMVRVPLAGLKEQSKTARCSGLMPGAPSMVPVASM